MILYKYDTNGDYIGTITPRVDERASSLKGETVYTKYLYTTELEPPETAENEVAVFDFNTFNWTKRTSYKGQYKLNTKTGVVSLIETHDPLKSYEVIIPADTYADMEADPDKYKVIEGVLTDISKTQEYQSAKDIAEYQKLIRETVNSYNEFLETPVEYQGKSYLPRYADDYVTLLNRGIFPVEVWDSTGLSSTIMSQAELADLKAYLDKLLNEAYKTKKENIKKYKLAIKKLEG